jgi:hypothetical protein
LKTIHSNQDSKGLIVGILAGTVCATALVGYLDFLTGREFGFFVFYFGPVGFAGWRLGLKSGIAISVISAAIWACADLATGYHYQHHFFPAWNAIIRLVAFLIIGVGSTNLRHAFDLQEKISRDLSHAMSQIKTLEALLPICASCKKIRDDKGQWQILEAYIGEHAGVKFSHGVCPQCAKVMIREAGLPEDLLDKPDDSLD